MAGADTDDRTLVISLQLPIKLRGRHLSMQTPLLMTHSSSAPVHRGMTEASRTHGDMPDNRVISHPET
jgi:hypothetical protein